MFLGAIIGGAFAFLAYGAYKHIVESSAWKTSRCIDAANVTDPTRQYRNHFDSLMGYIGTTDQDKAMAFVTKVTWLAVTQKQNSDTPISLKSAVESQLSFVLSEKKYAAINSFVQENENFDNLAHLVAKYFVTKSPIADTAVDTVTLAEVEADCIYESILSSYKSKDLDPEQLRGRMNSRKMQHIAALKTLVAFLQKHEGKNLFRRNLPAELGSSLDYVWNYCRANASYILERYRVAVVVDERSGSQAFQLTTMQELHDYYNGADKPMERIGRIMIRVGTRKALFLCTSTVATANAWMANRMENLDPEDLIVYASENHGLQAVFKYGEFLSLVERDEIQRDSSGRWVFYVHNVNGSRDMRIWRATHNYSRENLHMRRPELNSSAFDASVFKRI